jgi:hypothetical protein
MIFFRCRKREKKFRTKKATEEGKTRRSKEEQKATLLLFCFRVTEVR